MYVLMPVRTQFQVTSTKMAEGKHSKPHALMIALPFQGHISPFVSLAIKLAAKGFAITFVHTEFIHYTLFKSHHTNTCCTSPEQLDLFSQARESGLDISYTTISDGFPLEFDRVLHLEEHWESMLVDFPARVDEFIGKRLREFDPCLDNTFLIADTFYSWPSTIAEKYNMLNVSFWTQPALVLSISYHLELLRENGHFPCKDHIDGEINYVPGVIKPISTKDLMPHFKESESSTIVQKIVLKAIEEVKKADFILCNTIDDLEFETLSALNQKQPTYAIGPVNFSPNIKTSTITKSLWSESDCTEWLDSKPVGSVLYVSFGSVVQVRKQVIEEIAYGLVLSEVNFIWVVRADIVSSVEDGVLPVGFEEKIKDRGLIIPWCDQIKVLSNPGVGGFLTHCGWNSALESMWFGVPMVCYPLMYDQPTNRKLLVDDWKIGVNLSDHGMSVHRKEVAEKIKSFMNGQRLKEEVKKVNAIVRNALEPDGSSQRNFDQFIKDLKAKFHGKNEKVPSI